MKPKSKRRGARRVPAPPAFIELLSRDVSAPEGLSVPINAGAMNVETFFRRAVLYTRAMAGLGRVVLFHVDGDAGEVRLSSVEASVPIAAAVS